tara:strand:+ start:388 stop:585 length:198 start_codon:yes stop_codon:yes gene_type:complete
MKTPKGNIYCELCNKQVFKRGKDWRFKVYNHPNQRIICYDCVPLYQDVVDAITSAKKNNSRFFIL